MLAKLLFLNAALSSARTTDCALHGASLSLVSPRESNQREGDPVIRVFAVRRLPSLRRRSGGRVTTGRPCPAAPRSASCLSSPCATPAFGRMKGGWSEWLDGWVQAVENALRFSTLRWLAVGDGLVRGLRRRRADSGAKRTIRRGHCRCETGALHSRMHPTVVSLSRPQQLCSALLLSLSTPKPSGHTLAPSAGRAQVSWRGLSGRDAARAARARDGPSWRAPGAAPE